MAAPVGAAGRACYRSAGFDRPEDIMATDKRTEPSQTVEKLTAAFVLLVAVTLGILAWTVAELRADLRAARASQPVENAAAPDALAGEAELREEISRLSAELAATNQQLAGLVASLAAIEGGMKAVETRVGSADGRQQGFERWVITRLGPTPQPTALPAGWYEPQVEIINRIKAGDEPLAGWEKSVAGAQ